MVQPHSLPPILGQTRNDFTGLFCSFLTNFRRPSASASCVTQSVHALLVYKAMMNNFSLGKAPERGVPLPKSYLGKHWREEYTGIRFCLYDSGTRGCSFTCPDCNDSSYFYGRKEMGISLFTIRGGNRLPMEAVGTRDGARLGWHG